MQTPLDSIPPLLADALLTAHLLVWTVLALYGLHRLHLLRLFRRSERDTAPPPEAPAEWPRVTIQLPVYNERYVVARLLDAAAAVDYPRDRLEVQLLDDSVDETTAIAAAKVSELRAAGLDVVHVRRASRAGFKAAALQNGLESAKGEFLAIFDADFVPPPNFLRDTVPHFSDPGVGMVQARWRHLNQEYSALAQGSVGSTPRSPWTWYRRSASV